SRLPPLNKSPSQKKLESSISRFEQSYKDESNSEESFDSTDDEKQRQEVLVRKMIMIANVNIITSIRNFLETINQFKCPKCDKTDSYCFHITKRLGLVYFINFICSNCENVIRFTNGGRIMTSQTKNSQMTDMNMMLVLGGALVGLNRRGLSKVVGTLGMLPPVKMRNFQKYENELVVATREAADKSMSTAANEARSHFSSNDTSVSVDGTWMTQGFSSLHGGGTLISVSNPSKVLDYEILSRKCSVCCGLLGIKEKDGEKYKELLDEHLSGCEANYEGSAGGMESAAVRH
ncbi:unnamed protein product, partial [Didymodactylos carnosus]